MAKKLSLEDLSYDPETGFIIDLRDGRRVGYQPKPDSKSPKYRQVRVDGVLIYEHTLAWRLKTGSWYPPGMEIDHRDGNGFNNRWSNFRLATRTQNSRGFRRKSIGKTSKYRGVSFVKRLGRWRADIRVNRHRVFLGNYIKEADAASAYNVAVVKYFGEFGQIQ